VQKQKPLTYSESLKHALKNRLENPPVKFTELEIAIMEGGGSLEDIKVTELFDPKQSSELEWEKGVGVTYANGIINIDNKEVNIDITFANIDDGIINIEFMVGGAFDLTGKGGASQVFATVIEAVKKFVKEHPKVTTFTFTAEEKSRAKMYDTITKRVAKQLGWHVIPYDEMAADPKFRTAMSYGAFLFAIERGEAPEHRQSAQKPQHSEFLPIFYVYAYENDKLPTIKVKATSSTAAEKFVVKNVPGYEKEHSMSIFAVRAQPAGRKIIDMGTVPPPPPKPAPQDPNSLGARLRAKLDTPT
jgi:hypothetical protein